MKTFLNSKAFGYLLAAFCVLGILWYLKNKGTAAASAAINAINPASSTNIVNSAVTSVGKSLSGNADWTLGGWIYDVTHPGQPGGGSNGSVFVTTPSAGLVYGDPSKLPGDAVTPSLFDKVKAWL